MTPEKHVFQAAFRLSDLLSGGSKIKVESIMKRMIEFQETGMHLHPIEIATFKRILPVCGKPTLSHRITARDIR